MAHVWQYGLAVSTLMAATVFERGESMVPTTILTINCRDTPNIVMYADGLDAAHPQALEVQTHSGERRGVIGAQAGQLAVDAEFQAFQAGEIIASFEGGIDVIAGVPNTEGAFTRASEAVTATCSGRTPLYLDKASISD